MTSADGFSTPASCPPTVKSFFRTYWRCCSKGRHQMHCPSSSGALVLGSGSVLGTFVFGAGGRFQVVLPARNDDD